MEQIIEKLFCKFKDLERVITMQYYFNEATIILALRKLYGYSQQEFCTFLGYSQSTLSKIEHGHCSPDMKFVISLAQKINIDLNIFKFGFIPRIPEYLLTSKTSRFLKHEYLKEGVFSAKTTYLLLESLEEELGLNIYKLLGISKEYFVFSELKYGLNLFRHILNHVDKEDVIRIIESAQANKTYLLAEESFKACLLNLQLIQIENIVKIGDSYELGLSYLKGAIEEDSEMREYFQYIIAFQLLNELNVNVVPVRMKKSKHEFMLRLNAG